MDIELNLKIGDLIFYKNPTLIGKEIRELQNSPYSHVAGVIKPNELIEADWFGVEYEALDTYVGMSDIYRCDISDIQREQLAQYVTKQLGKRYSYLLLAWEFFRYKFNITLPYKNKNSIICSKLWNDGYRFIGNPLSDYIFASPDDLIDGGKIYKIGSY